MRSRMRRASRFLLPLLIASTLLLATCGALQAATESTASPPSQTETGAPVGSASPSASTTQLGSSAPTERILGSPSGTITTAATPPPTTTIANANETKTETSPEASAATSELAATSVASDVIGVSYSEEFTTASGSDILDSSATDTPTEPAGIEPKSISHAAASGDSGNSLQRADGDSDTNNSNNNKVTGGSESNAKLSVDVGGVSAEEPGVDEEEAATSEAPALKLPSRLNLTQIDQIYLTGRKEEQETVEDWNKLSKKLKKGISGVIGTVVPFALNMSQEAKISSNCSGAMLKWVLSLNQLKAWSLRMLDASGKPVAGLLEGSMTMFGNYRQCLKVRAPDDDEIEFAGEFREYFRGKYCIVQVKPWLPKKDRFYNLNAKLRSLVSEEENEWYDRSIFEELSEWLLAFNFVNIRYDLCVPSLCSREDIQKAVNYLLKGIDMKARVLRCEMDLPSSKLGLAAQVETGAHEVAEALVAKAAASASSEEPAAAGAGELRFMSQLGWSLLPLVAVALVMIATLLSLITRLDDKGAANEETRSNKLRHTIRSISLKRSFSSHLNVDYDQLADDKPLALYGLRFLLVLWVILVESAVNLKFEYLRELMMLKDLIFWWPMQFIINSTLQYDSFILLTAFTMAYKNCLNDTLNHAKSLSRFVLDKYIRLMPSIMVMVALVILLPLAYRGPVWNDYVAKQSAVCQSTGWLNAIFLQNYMPYDSICLPQTWLLCVEFQLILIMAPLVYYLNKSYSANFSTNSKARMGPNADGGTDSIKKKQQTAQGPSARTDSSKLFHWLWTAPGMILVGCIVLGLAGSFYNVYYNELPPTWFYTMADPDSKALYFGEHMTKIWTHLAVFAMGILAGVECRRATRNVHCGYGSSNIDFVAHTNAFSAHHHHHHQKGQSSSAASLPMMLARNGNDFSESSRLATGEHWAANNGRVGSSVSIDIQANHHHHCLGQHHNDDGTLASSSAGGSEIGCIHSSRENNNNAHNRGICPLLLDILGFIITITIMSAVIFSTHDWSLNNLPEPLVAGLFDAGSRFFWSMGMIWILFNISVPYKDRSFSLLARSLGHPAMVCLGKLSFLIYIIHPFVHTAVLAIQEQPIYSSWLMLFHILIGNMTITVILASIVSLFVEMPCRNLFRRCGTSLLLTQSIQRAASSGGSIGAS